MLEHLRSANQTLTGLAGSRPGGVTITMDGRAETASALLTTGNYYSLLGVNARLGRTLTAEDDSPSAPAVAMVSHAYWQSRFNASDAVLGKLIRCNSVPVTIVGVAPPDFTGTQHLGDRLQDVLLPLKLDDQLSSRPATDERRDQLVGAGDWTAQTRHTDRAGSRQSRGGVSKRGARRHACAPDLSFRDRTRDDPQIRMKTAPPCRSSSLNRQAEVCMTSAQVKCTRSKSSASVVGLVLLLVCANVANLLLSRVTTRQKEISIRLSIGATRARLARQLLTESLLLSALGGAAGFFVARWTQALLPEPIGTAAPPDWRVVAFTAALTLVVGVVFGIAPALRGTRMEVGTAMKQNSRSVAAGNTLLSRGLLVLQVSISLVVLVGAGLFLRTLDNLRSVDIGWDPQNLIFVRVNAEGAQLDHQQKLRYYQDGMDRLGAIPGVRHATVSKPTLMSGGVSSTAMYVQGRVYPKGRDSYAAARDDINRVTVAPNYFEAMGIPVVAGRGFTDRDHEKAPQVAVINQAAALKFFPNENPIGRTFGTSIDETPDIEIVGVLRDTRYNNLREAPPPTLYVPHLQHNPEDLVFSVRTAGDPASIMTAARTAVSSANAGIPVVTVQTQMSTLDSGTRRRRFSPRHTPSLAPSRCSLPRSVCSDCCPTTCRDARAKSASAWRWVHSARKCSAWCCANRCCSSVPASPSASRPHSRPDGLSPHSCLAWRRPIP